MKVGRILKGRGRKRDVCFVLMNKRRVKEKEEKDDKVEKEKVDEEEENKVDKEEEKMEEEVEEFRCHLGDRRRESE